MIPLTEKKLHKHSRPPLIMLTLVALFTGLVFSSPNAIAQEEESRTGIVTANKLNVRVKPALKFEVVAKLKQGAEVTILSKTEDWLEILAPETATAWCAAHLLAEDGTVKEDELRVRSGPGVVFSAYGTLEKGEVVEKNGDLVNGWQPIKPPTDATAWVSRRFIKVEQVKAELMPDQKTDTAQKGENSAEEDTKAATASDTPTEPQRQENPDEESAQEGENEPATAPLQMGVIIPLEERKTTFATHILADVRGNKAYPKAYLRSPRIELDKWEYKSVRIHGRKIDYEGWSRPVFVVRGIERQHGNDNQN
ncbi:MAG: SH3 domain-containing protein [Lentisphaeria bacterium]